VHDHLIFIFALLMTYLGEIPISRMLEFWNKASVYWDSLEY